MKPLALIDSPANYFVSFAISTLPYYSSACERHCATLFLWLMSDFRGKWLGDNEIGIDDKADKSETKFSRFSNNSSTKITRNRIQVEPAVERMLIKCNWWCGSDFSPRYLVTFDIFFQTENEQLTNARKKTLSDIVGLPVARLVEFWIKRFNSYVDLKSGYVCKPAIPNPNLKILYLIYFTVLTYSRYVSRYLRK